MVLEARQRIATAIDQPAALLRVLDPTHKTFLTVDASKPHMAEAADEGRFSIIFYTIRRWETLSSARVAYLEGLGFQWPASAAGVTMDKMLDHGLTASCTVPQSVPASATPHSSPSKSARDRGRVLTSH